MNNNDKPRFEIEIDNFDYESGFDDISNEKQDVIDKSFLNKYEHYDNDDKPVEKKVKVYVPPKKKNGDGRFIVKMVVAVAILTSSVFMSLFSFSIADDLIGIAKKSGTAIVNIPQGATVEEIGQILEQNGIIKFPKVFKFYVSRRYSSTIFQSGQVAIDLSKANGYDNVVVEIKQVPRAETVMLSFPEGYTIEQIANKLEENRVCSATNFIAAVKAADFSNYAFVKDINYDGKYLALEGYIFPDTYEFYLNDNAANVVKRFLDNFDARFTDEMKARADELGLTVDEVIILASIIQKEAGDPKEMARVSSVFHNRLNNTVETQGRLQSDITYEYVNNYIRPHVDEAMIDKYDSSYNTYNCIGIPVGAFCNPGVDAINAVLYPADTDYYYFVTDDLGNFYYAKTLAEHNENVEKAFAVGKGD